MTPTQIAAIKGMLAYFDSGNNIPVDKAVIKGNCAEVAALRAALAETAPVQEPVGWSMTYNGSHVGNFYESRSYAEERMTDLNGKHPDALRTVEPLYAAPQAQQPSPPADVPMLTDAVRYKKLRRWMSSNVKEGWEEVERMGAVASWVGWDDFDAYLDALPECAVGLVSPPVSTETN